MNPELLSSSRLRNPRSKGRLWATNTVSPMNAEKLSATAANDGAAATMPSSIPVMEATNGGIGTPGLISEAKDSPIRPFSTRTAPTSRIRSLAWEPPVVSRSTTVKLAARRGPEGIVGLDARTIDPSETNLNRRSPETISPTIRAAIAGWIRGTRSSTRQISSAGRAPRSWRSSCSSCRRRRVFWRKVGGAPVMAGILPPRRDLSRRDPDRP
jgi:hypothetical protein